MPLNKETKPEKSMAFNIKLLSLSDGANIFKIYDTRNKSWENSHELINVIISVWSKNKQISTTNFHKIYIIKKNRKKIFCVFFF